MPQRLTGYWGSNDKGRSPEALASSGTARGEDAGKTPGRLFQQPSAQLKPERLGPLRSKQINCRPFPPFTQGAERDLSEVPTRKHQEVWKDSLQHPAIPVPRLLGDVLARSAAIHRQPHDER